MNACHLVFVVAVCLLPFSGASARDDDTNKVDVAILDVNFGIPILLVLL